MRVFIYAQWRPLGAEFGVAPFLSTSFVWPYCFNCCWWTIPLGFRWIDKINTLHTVELAMSYRTVDELTRGIPTRPHSTCLSLEEKQLLHQAAWLEGNGCLCAFFRMWLCVCDDSRRCWCSHWVSHTQVQRARLTTINHAFLGKRNGDGTAAAGWSTTHRSTGRRRCQDDVAGGWVATGVHNQLPVGRSFQIRLRVIGPKWESTSYLWSMAEICSKIKVVLTEAILDISLLWRCVTFVHQTAQQFLKDWFAWKPCAPVNIKKIREPPTEGVFEFFAKMLALYSNGKCC